MFLLRVFVSLSLQNNLIDAIAVLARKKKTIQIVDELIKHEQDRAGSPYLRIDNKTEAFRRIFKGFPRIQQGFYYLFIIPNFYYDNHMQRLFVLHEAVGVANQI